MTSMVSLTALADIADSTQLAINFGSDAFKLALFDGSMVAPDPEAFTAYGSAPFNANESAAGGGYTTGGVALVSPTWAVQAGTQRIRYNTSSLVIAGVTLNVRWLLHYDDSVSDRAWYLCDLGAEYPLSGEDANINVDGNGWFRIRA